MALKTRRKFECWQCQRTYSLLIEPESKPTVYLECPYCGTECVADLAPYRKDIVEIHRTDSAGQTSSSATTWNFPDVIPTTEPDK